MLTILKQSICCTSNQGVSPVLQWAYVHQWWSRGQATQDQHTVHHSGPRGKTQDHWRHIHEGLSLHTLIIQAVF